MPRSSRSLASSLLVALDLVGLLRQACLHVVANLIFVLRIAPPRLLRSPQQQSPRGTSRRTHTNPHFASPAGAVLPFSVLPRAAKVARNWRSHPPDEMGTTPSALVDRVDANADN